jgi:hypothetical protein
MCISNVHLCLPALVRQSPGFALRPEEEQSLPYSLDHNIPRQKPLQVQSLRYGNQNKHH